MALGCEKFVSVVVPIYNELEYVEKLIFSIRSQRNLPKNIEIIFADGGSTDGTLVLLNKLIDGDESIRIVNNEKRFVSHGLNLAIKHAKGDIIIRLDAHTLYSDDYISKSIETLECTNAFNVGGPARTRFNNFFQKANSAAYKSVFSVGGARFHQENFSGYVDTVPYGCWYKEKLLEIGGFDENLIRNQDDELNFRAINAGLKIYQSSDIKSWYFPRSTLGKLFMQYFQYGFWKVFVIKKHSSVASFRQLVPVIFVTSVFFLMLSGFFNEFFWCVLVVEGLLYFLVGLCFSVVAAREVKDWRLIAALPLIFLVYHSSYGIGFLIGIMASINVKVSKDKLIGCSSR